MNAAEAIKDYIDINRTLNPKFPRNKKQLRELLECAMREGVKLGEQKEKMRYQTDYNLRMSAIRVQSAEVIGKVINDTAHSRTGGTYSIEQLETFRKLSHRLLVLLGLTKTPF